MRRAVVALLGLLVAGSSLPGAVSATAVGRRSQLAARALAARGQLRIVIMSGPDAKEDGGSYAVLQAHRRIAQGTFVFETPVRLALPAGLYTVTIETVFTHTTHTHVRVVAGTSRTFRITVN